MADAESGNRIASLIHREQESSIRAGDHFLIRIIRPKALRRITLPGAAGQKLPDWAQRAIRGIASEGDHRVLPRLRVVRFHKNKFGAGIVFSPHMRNSGRHERAGFQHLKLPAIARRPARPSASL